MKKHPQRPPLSPSHPFPTDRAIIEALRKAKVKDQLIRDIWFHFDTDSLGDACLASIYNVLTERGCPVGRGTPAMWLDDVVCVELNRLHHTIDYLRREIVRLSLPVEIKDVVAKEVIAQNIEVMAARRAIKKPKDPPESKK